MKKYIVINKKTNEVFGKFDTKIAANKNLIDYIVKSNQHSVNGYVSVFDFEIQEEIKEINSYLEACEYLELPEDIKYFDKLFVRDRKHIKALNALSMLFTIAEAWNKQDGFVPDFSNENQYKYFPWFEYNDDVERFVCVSAYWSVVDAPATVGTRLCFATRERAIDFGKKFQDLYNDFL